MEKNLKTLRDDADFTVVLKIPGETDLNPLLLTRYHAWSRFADTEVWSSPSLLSARVFSIFVEKTFRKDLYPLLITNVMIGIL